MQVLFVGTQAGLFVRLIPVLRGELGVGLIDASQSSSWAGDISDGPVGI